MGLETSFSVPVFENDTLILYIFYIAAELMS